jgi:hypothetical protein
MKILRQGILPQNVIYTGTCHNCGCQIEASYTEVARRNLGDRYSGEFIECSLPCPTNGCCRKIVMFEKPTPKPTPKSEMDKAFEELFGDTPLPASPRQPNVSSITEGCARKEPRRSCRPPTELLRRMKKLPGIREKTLDELFDELFD